VTVTGFSAREAQTYALAALSRGTAAPGWLRSLGVTAELVSTDGQRVLVPHEPRRVSR